MGRQTAPRCSRHPSTGTLAREVTTEGQGRTLGPGFPVMPRGPLSPLGPWTEGENGGRSAQAPTITEATFLVLHPAPHSVSPGRPSGHREGYRWASLPPGSRLSRCPLEAEKGCQSLRTTQPCSGARPPGFQGQSDWQGQGGRGPPGHLVILVWMARMRACQREKGTTPRPRPACQLSARSRPAWWLFTPYLLPPSPPPLPLPFSVGGIIITRREGSQSLSYIIYFCYC